LAQPLEATRRFAWSQADWPALAMYCD